ncbi:DUF7146 domain-containing protein [Paracoccus aminovorans]|uniref:DUF7146 domain-containing protein n=1 Tax=Paracoccus aminovorans TaxID=34004 RepID=UPI000782A7C5|nr:hypothetical protein [Paracoccus aminovorans]
MALWLSGQERIQSTPVEYYLRDTRGIDLAQLDRQPGARRYHPAVRYKHLDRETGEVWDCEMPAMLSFVNDGQARCEAHVCLRRAMAGFSACRTPGRSVRSQLGDGLGQQP